MKPHPLFPGFLAASLLALTPAPWASAGTVIDLSTQRVPTVVGAGAEEQFGYAGDSGDLDGDGETELIVGAPGRPTPGAAGPAGAVYILDAGSVAALEAPAEALALAWAVISGMTPGERFGETVLVADVNADSLPDLIVGAPSWGPGEQVATGRIHIFLGPLAASSTLLAADADVTIHGEAPGNHFGSSLASGDIDRDGAADLLVSAFRAGPADAPGAGRVYVISAGALRAAGRRAPAADVASSVITGNARGDALRGIAVVATGIDERTFVALGSYHADGRARESVDVGSVAIVDGAALLSAPRHSVGEFEASIILGPRPRGFLGRSIASGDIDDDGTSDLLLSAYASRGKNRKADASGEVFVVFGDAAGFPDTLDLARGAVPAFSGRERWDLFGLPVLLADVIIVGEASQDALGGCLFAAPAEGRSLHLVIGAPDAGRSEVERSGKIHLIPAELLTGR